MSDFEIIEDIRMARFKQRDATVRWAILSFVIGMALTNDMLNTVLISVIGSLAGYLLYGWEVHDLENKRVIGGKK
jgi:hypothetical protein